MPLEDFFADMFQAGAEGQGWKSWFVIAWIVIGAGAGCWLGYSLEGVVGAVGGTCIGAFVGWILGMVLRGLLIFAVIFLAILVVVLGWTWITGGFA